MVVKFVEHVRSYADKYSIMQSFLDNPSSIISFAAMCITIVLFILNIVFDYRKSKIAFRRNLDLRYYEITVLDTFKEIYRRIKLIEKEYINLLKDYSKTETSESLVEICQSHLMVLDEHFENADISLSASIALLSEKRGNYVSKLLVEFYDYSTTIMTEFSIKELSEDEIEGLSKLFFCKKNKITKLLYCTCKDLTP